MNPVLKLEFSILDFIAQYFHNGIFDVIMPVITRLCDNGEVWICLALILLCIPKQRRIGLQLILALLFSFLLCNLFLKNVVARPRPFALREGIDLLIAAPRDFSFPSGHSSASFAAAMVLFRNHFRWAVPALLLAILIAFSRLYLYVHYPSDVLAGALLGCLCGYLSTKVFSLAQETLSNKRGELYGRDEH